MLKVTWLLFLGLKLTPVEEEELMKKWQEILGPNNEVVVGKDFFKGKSYCI